MMVKMSRRAPDGPPKLIAVHTKLRSLYGSAAFRKGEAKGALKTAGLGHSTGYVTRLMETGSIVPA
jgi:hypothetical protein